MLVFPIVSQNLGFPFKVVWNLVQMFRVVVVFCSGCCELVVVWKAQTCLVCQKQISLSECRQGFHADVGAGVFGFGRISFSGVADFASFVYCFLSMSVVQHICGVGFVWQVFYKCSVGSVVFSGFFAADVFFRFRWSQFGVS